MKRTWILRFLTAAICLTGGVALATAQYSDYTQGTDNFQQCYSALQYQSSEIAAQPGHYESYGDAISYQPAEVYQSPVIHTGQVIYSSQVYSEQPLNTSPVVGQAGYSSNGVPSYSSVISSSYPVEVTASAYRSPSHPASQGLQTIQHSSASYSPSTQTVSRSRNQYTSTNPQPGLAQQKAQQAAQMAFRDHIGGGLGGAKFEGVGWSNQSPRSAIQNCCYWGQKPPAQIGVSKSHDGCWYACVLYH